MLFHFTISYKIEVVSDEVIHHIFLPCFRQRVQLDQSFSHFTAIWIEERCLVSQEFPFYQFFVFQEFINNSL